MKNFLQIVRPYGPTINTFAVFVAALAHGGWSIFWSVLALLLTTFAIPAGGYTKGGMLVLAGVFVLWSAQSACGPFFSPLVLAYIAAAIYAGTAH